MGGKGDRHTVFSWGTEDTIPIVPFSWPYI